MKEFFTSRKGSQALMGIALFVVAFLFSFDSALAQRPMIPKLSLVGSDGSYDNTWYPDGKIWIAPKASEQSPREFLVPVFIDNRWYSYKDGTSDTIRYVADPIRSFRFKVLYDSSAIRAVGVETDGPRHNPDDLDYAPLAAGFDVDWYDSVDFQYLRALQSTPTFQDYSRGRGLTITGASKNKALPNTSLFGEEYKVLLYIRFRVMPNVSSPTGVYDYTPIQIAPDLLVYNDLNVALEAPFQEMRNYDPRVADEYPDPVPNNYWDQSNQTGVFPGLGGVSTKTISNSPDLYMPGVVWVKLMDALPKFGFQINRAIGQQPPIAERTPWYYEIVDPITVDMKQQDPNFPIIGSRNMEVLNLTSISRLTDVEIESDQSWLEFRTLPGTGNNNAIPSPVRKGKIPWIDTDILGTLPDVLGEQVDDDGAIVLQVRCNPANLKETGDDDQPRPDIEKTGIYTGHLTFKSAFAEFTPVRVKVTFIYFRPPLEGQRQGVSAGIKLDMTNSRDAQAGGQETTRLIFGTGERATNGVDTLFGEYAYETPQPTNRFTARFYPVDDNGEQVQDVADYGFGDFSTNDEQIKSESRDIRDYNDTLQSITYLVKFNANGDQNYPVILEWDVRDFPEGGDLYLRDTKNGTLFPGQNMRIANTTGQYTRSYILQDPRIVDFVIEYTLPRVIDYVDEDGLPIIKKGWNLLSLPVRPLNAVYTNVYPNALNIPYYFFNNGYQQETELKVGRGYYVKYGNTIDRQFSGSFIGELSLNRGNAPKVYGGDTNRGGWNLVGAVSVPAPIENLSFEEDPTSDDPLPSTQFTRKHGVWGYKTNEGYRDVSVMEPGLGYWIKVDNQGYMKLVAPPRPDGGKTSLSSANAKDMAKNAANKVTVRDNAQAEGIVYLSTDDAVNVADFQMPPAAPMGLFDVRFSGNTNLENAKVSYLSLQGVTYPASISIMKSNVSLKFEDAVTGEAYGTITAGTNGSVEIPVEVSGSVKITMIETESASAQVKAYPNPVATSTTLEYYVAEKGNVSIVLFDEVGNAIQEVYNGSQNAGVQRTDVNVSNLPSGNYIARIVSGGNTQAAKVTVVK